MWQFLSRAFSAQIAIAAFVQAARPAVANDLLSVPVQSVTSAATPSRMGMTTAPMRKVPQVTPAARLPHYQLHQEKIGEFAQAPSSQVRFLLLVPGRPVVVDAELRIDGQPYTQVREQRVQDVLKFIDSQAEASNTGDPATDPTPVNKGDVRKPVDAASSPPAMSTNEQPKESSGKPVARYHPPDTFNERIRRHMQSTGTQPSAQEVRWMMANLTDGPVLLFLNNNFQRFRALQQPMFYVLDTNHDKLISAEEMASAIQTLESCDLDRNDIVESTEIAKVASDPRNWDSGTQMASPALYPLGQAADVEQLPLRLIQIYGQADSITTIDSNRDGKLDANEHESLLSRPPDLGLRIEFNTTNATASWLTVASAADAFEPVIHSAAVSNNSILLNFPDYALELSAVQGSASDQISIGAINDGYAMLPELDTNGDGRFTIRERRMFLDRLKSFDRDGDNSIAWSEMFPTYRLCIALGPNAHHPLSLLRKSRTTAVPQSSPPDWFIQMDRNNDLDLSRNEFPGTDEQFQQLDLDRDLLISSDEAEKSQN